jgi:hypothetical protein
VVIRWIHQLFKYSPHQNMNYGWVLLLIQKPIFISIHKVLPKMLTHKESLQKQQSKTKEQKKKRLKALNSCISDKVESSLYHSRIDWTCQSMTYLFYFSIVHKYTKQAANSKKANQSLKNLSGMSVKN